ncbi:hypothetical protein HYDPIDRAFT_101218, partial [Hydnomerulius pinastri MD-312]
KREAEDEMLSIRQGKGSVEDFFLQLEMVAYNADYKLDHHAGLLISILRRGINSDIIDFVENCHPQLLDERNYIDWKTAVIKAEATLSERARRKGAKTLFFSPVETRRDGTGVVYSGAGRPMDVDAQSRRGLCWKCGESGHISRNCPNKQRFKVVRVTNVHTLFKLLLRSVSNSRLRALTFISF